uniref:hypothetical protein n=1 Tax=Crocosphaera watsonii TaxID=263511 RepID=UPI0030D887D2
MSNSDWKIPLLAIALSDEAIAVFKNFPDTVENQAQPSFGEIKCDCPEYCPHYDGYFSGNSD